MILSACGQKGGAGKSSAAIALGDELFRRGFRVLLVDADAEQGTLSTWRAIAKRGGLQAPTVVSMGESLDDDLPGLARDFDHVLIDCPGRIDLITDAALMVSHYALLPCGPTHADAWALTKSVALVKKAQKYNKGLRAGVLVTKKKPRTSLGKAAREVVTASGFPVLGAEFTHRVAYEEFLGSGLGITRYAPADAAADEVRAAVDEIFQKDEGSQEGSRPWARVSERRCRRCSRSPNRAPRRLWSPPRPGPPTAASEPPGRRQTLTLRWQTASRRRWTVSGRRRPPKGTRQTAPGTRQRAEGRRRRAMGTRPPDRGQAPVPR